MINQVSLGARIVSEINLRNTAKKGIAVADFRVIHRDRRLPHPLFIDVEVWGNEAKRIHENTKRGDTVVIVGELRRDVWTSKEGNEQRSKIKITANRVVVTEQFKSKDSTEAGITASLM